jgi:hypothetical protein
MYRKPSRSARAEWSQHAEKLLQLDLYIDETRSVAIRHAFTFAAHRRLRGMRTTPFRAEIHDSDGKVRACAPLEESCFHCGIACWPRHLVAEMPIDPKRARKLVIFENEHEIASFEIPPPPQLTLDEVHYSEDGMAIVRWTAKDEKDLAYLVHWQDEMGVWRGAAPRQKETEIVISKRLRLGKRKLPIRVLASNGLATTLVKTTVEPLQGRRDPDKDPLVTIMVSSGDAPIVRALAIDHLGRSVPGADLLWFDEKGGEVGRGPTLDTRQIGGGKHTVRVVAVNAGAGKAERDVDIIGRKERPTRKPKPIVCSDKLQNSEGSTGGERS